MNHSHCPFSLFYPAGHKALVTIICTMDPIATIQLATVVQPIPKVAFPIKLMIFTNITMKMVQEMNDIHLCPLMEAMLEEDLAAVEVVEEVEMGVAQVDDMVTNQFNQYQVNKSHYPKAVETG